MNSARTPRSRLARALVALIIAFCLGTAPATAGAAVLDRDLVGGNIVGTSAAKRATAPDLYIPAGMLVTSDGRELWSRDARARRAMASTTKIMTAVVVIENSSPDDEVVVSKNAAKVKESSVGLRAGERVTVDELLDGLLIQSGNDAATALAEHVGGSEAAFVDMMNAKAAALDMADTHYMNPHGLDVPGHYTSAADLTAVARYAMRIPRFRESVAKYKSKIVGAKYTHQLTSHNILLKVYDGAIGIKTGWTDEAGYCIVAAAKRGDVELVATVLGAASEQGRNGQAVRLLDWGFQHYKTTSLATAGEHLGEVPVDDWLDVSVGAQVATGTSMPVFDLAGPVRRVVALKPGLTAPVAKCDRIGTMTVYQGDRLLAQLPAVADRAVRAPEWWERVSVFFQRTWRGIVGEGDAAASRT